MTHLAGFPTSGGLLSGKREGQEDYHLLAFARSELQVHAREDNCVVETVDVHVTGEGLDRYPVINARDGTRP